MSRKSNHSDSNSFADDMSLQIPTNKSQMPVEEGLTSEEYNLALRAYQAALRERMSISFRRDRARAVHVGSKAYIWQLTGVSDGACERCASLHNMRFCWDQPPEGGHPGENTCCDIGWCRCWAKPVPPA